MLSDEEKEAINSLIEIREFGNLSSYLDIKINQLNAIDILLNLIEKQQKEIERLNNKFEKIYNEIDNKNSQLVKALNYKLFIEDKIKAKVIEIKNRPVKDEFITVTQAKLNTIIEIESLLERS